MVYDRIRALVESLRQGLVERDEPLRLTLLAALSGESIALLGPAGVAKSAVAMRVTDAFTDASSFTLSLGGFTTGDELFGPAAGEGRGSESLEGHLRRSYLPDARMITLRNIWNASRPLRDALLPVVADRQLRKGGELHEVPWRLLVGTADYLPPLEEGSRPFWDRFLLRVAVTPVTSSEGFRELLRNPGGAAERIEEPITDAEWSRWQGQIDAVELSEEVIQLIGRMREVLHARNEERLEEGLEAIYVSDRRWVELTRILKASAFFHDRTAVDPLDALLIRHGIWERPEQREEVNEVIRKAISEYAASDRFETRKLRLELRRLTDEIENQRIDYEEEEVREFERYRGEYYVIEEFIEDFTTLIWIEDFEALLAETPRTIELFFYNDQDQLSHTETLPVRRAGEARVEISGELFPLRGIDVRRSVAERRKLTAGEARGFRARLEEIGATCRQRIEEIEHLSARGRSESREHLFVKREYAQLLIEGLEESVENLMELETEIRVLESEAFDDS